ncbi:MAG: hypothetical protein G01um101466_512 [Parcubacteria group bacterium Gr01-1014_66]|nr:MAG: hypothetical protein G01um101466_512 [Parcubacteria group bacterium Gr01-1014_66]
MVMAQELSNQKETTFLGRCNFRGKERVFGIKTKDRRQHTYVIGKTGTGKTTLLENMVLQDIHAGRGLGIIDPHGEFVERVLEQIPSNRIGDVVYFNPVDTEYPIGFNVLEVSDPKYKHLVVSDLLGIFTKIWANVWSARMEYILQNCILALIDTPGTTLLGIPRLLVDKTYREIIVAQVKDPVVRSFWIHEFGTWRDQFRDEAIVPIQNKVGQFLNTNFIRNIVGQPKSTLNIPDVINHGKILLVNVSKGRVGEDNSQLLGAMIITKIQLATMERVRILEEDRQDFYLYVDEFQNFATDSFASILSEARKYRLNLIIAHQYIGQLVTDVSTKVRDSVFGNVGTVVTFRIGAADAEFLEKEFTPEFMPEDLINLPNHQVYIKIMVDGVTSRPFSSSTLPPLKYEKELGIKEQVILASRTRYARPHSEVEEEITQWGQSGFGGGGRANSATQFNAICANCGKNTTVPFQPDGRRPVYCTACLKLIEDGKLIPLPERMPQVGRARFGTSLGELGIEFPRESFSGRASGRQYISHTSGASDALPRTPSFGEVRHIQGIGAGGQDKVRDRGRPRKSFARDVPKNQLKPRMRESSAPISLSTLKPRPIIREKEKSQPPSLRPSIDLEGLRKELAGVLGVRPAETGKKPSSVETQDTPRVVEKKQNDSDSGIHKKRAVQPGERISL